MLRWLFVGLLLAGVGIGFQRQWIQVDSRKFFTDINLPFLADPDPIRRFQLKTGGF
jgi:hypothetical protein